MRVFLILFIFVCYFSTFSFGIDVDFLKEIETPFLVMVKDCRNDEWILDIDDFGLKYKPAYLGSLIKIFTIIAKFNNRSLNISESYTCKGFDATDYSVCWLKSGHGTLSLLPAFSVSCNSYFYYFSRDIDFGLFLEILKDWGLYYSIENNGRKILNREEQIAAMIGKGNFIKIKPIDFFNAMENLIFRKKYLPDDIYNTIITGMSMVYENGTVKDVRKELRLSSEMNIICKTGTGQYEENGKVDIRKVNGFFVGVLGQRYLCFVMIEKVRGIGAAKIGLKILSKL